MTSQSDNLQKLSIDERIAVLEAAIKFCEEQKKKK